MASTMTSDETKQLVLDTLSKSAEPMTTAEICKSGATNCDDDKIVHLLYELFSDRQVEFGPRKLCRVKLCPSTSWAVSAKEGQADLFKLPTEEGGS